MRGSIAEKVLMRAGVAQCMHGRKTLVFTLCCTVFNAPHHTWEGNKHRGKGLLKSFDKISSKTPEREQALLSHCEGEGGARSPMKTEGTLQ